MAERPKMRGRPEVVREGATPAALCRPGRDAALAAALGAVGAGVPAQLWGAALPAGMAGAAVMAAYVGTALFLERRRRAGAAPRALEAAAREFRAALAADAAEGMLVAHRDEGGWTVRDADGELRRLSHEEWPAWRRGAEGRDIPLLVVRAASVRRETRMGEETRDNLVVVERSCAGLPMGCGPDDPAMRLDDPSTGWSALSWATRGGRDDTAHHRGLLLSPLSEANRAETLSDEKGAAATRDCPENAMGSTRP